MMICPACNYELVLHNGYCENCGAPGYLVTASQTADITHCTYCGARDERGGNDCATCGLKKNFKAYENLIGTCRNCGVAWRSVWMYCQTCGVARENGLVDTTLPITVSFQSDRSPTPHRSTQAAYSLGHNHSHERHQPVPDTRDTYFTYPDFDPTAELETQSLLSENEVVERMYVNSDEETTFSGKIDREDFFSESEIADTRRPTTWLPASEATELPSTDSAAIYDLSFAAPPEPGIPPTQPLDSAAREERAPAITAQVTTALPTQKSSAASQTPVPASALKLEATPVTSPVQAVRIIKQSRTPTTPPIDKKLVKIIAVLIFLVLLFSALIVSGVRLRDLVGKPPQASPQAEVRPSAAPAQTEASQAPEGMVQIPGGVFRMGLDDGDAYEAPAHEVTIASFFMDRTEVTNAQYAAFLKATNHRAPPDWKSGLPPAGTEKFPVVNVSWQDANDYAAWAEKRLPTEAEWEFAARAKDSRHYPWGSNWDATKANTSESNLNHPVEVGSYANAANPLGLLDMAGNVWEWTAGEVTSYKDSSIALAPGKVIRGGAFYAAKDRATTTFRGFAPPDKQATGIGFRCVKDVR